MKKSDTASRSNTARTKAALREDLWSLITPEKIWKDRTGRGVRVAVVDTGVDATHPALAGKVEASVEAYKDARGRVSFRPSQTGDDAGHGTACAGIVAQIAPGALIHSVKVLGAHASGSGEMFLAGLDYAIRQKARVINLSLGTTRPELAAPLNELINRAYQAGSIIVAAANNLPQPSFPSVFCSSVVSVSKQESSDPFAFTYRFGETIELLAPGVGVNTAWPGGGYRQLTGNSFACPHVAGVIALILEAYPTLTPFQVKTILYSVARRNMRGA